MKKSMKNEFDAFKSEDNNNICQIRRCSFSSRHHETRTDIENAPNNEDLNFYMETMHSLHFYLYHLFDVGLRIKSSSDKKEEKQKEMDESELKQLMNPFFIGYKIEYFIRFNYVIV